VSGGSLGNGFRNVRRGKKSEAGGVRANDLNENLLNNQALLRRPKLRLLALGTNAEVGLPECNFFINSGVSHGGGEVLDTIDREPRRGNFIHAVAVVSIAKQTT